MDTKLTVERIAFLSKNKGLKMKVLCQTLGVRDNYFTDCKRRNLKIPDSVLKPAATLLDTTVEYLKGETDDPLFHLSSVGLSTFAYGQSGTRPVYGFTSAGRGVFAQQELLGQEPVDPEYDDEEYFWLQVKGDSMSPVLDDRDLVLVKKEAPVESNTLMVVVVDDTEGFIKKVTVLEDTVTLWSFNPQYPPRVFGGSDIGRLRFVGRVVQMKRSF